MLETYTLDDFFPGSEERFIFDNYVYATAFKDHFPEYDHFFNGIVNCIDLVHKLSGIKLHAVEIKVKSIDSDLEISVERSYWISNGSEKVVADIGFDINNARKKMEELVNSWAINQTKELQAKLSEIKTMV